MFGDRRGYYNNNNNGGGGGGYGWDPRPRNHQHPNGAGRRRPQAPPSGARRGGGTFGGQWKDHLWTAAIAAVSLGVWYATPVSQWVTDVLLWQVPVSDDVMLGRQALQEGFAYKYPTVYDHHYTPLLQSIGHDLVRTHRKQRHNQQWLSMLGDDTYQWDFAIVQSDAINAFALPGGIVRVTSSLLRALQPTPGELAALVGHEMGHVLHRHTQARMLQHQLLANVLQAVIDGIWNENGGNNQYRGAGGRQGSRRRRKPETFGGVVGDVLLQSAQWLGDQKFSRRDEYQADAVAWDLLLHSDSYNPQSVISLLSKLERLEHGGRATATTTKSGTSATATTDSPRGITSAIEEWTRTHPATSDRLKALEKKWKGLSATERRRLQQRRVA